MKRNVLLFTVVFSLLWVSLSARTLESQVRTEVYDYIESRVEADSFAIFVELPQNGSLLAKQMPRARFLIDWGKGNSALTGRIMIPVKIFDGPGFYSEVQVIATIKRYEYVCVTNQMLGRHNEILDSDIRFELRDVSDVYLNPIVSFTECLGKRTKRVISANRMITEDMIEFPPLVERGNPVKIVLRHRNLEITTTGIARQDGWKGDIIRVRQHSGKHVIQCVVKSGNVVMANL